MLPWIERPTIDLDLALPPEERYARFPDAVLASGRQLLAAIMQEIPAQARALAYWVRLRTAGRFHKEAVALARQVGADWRDVMLANVTYDLMLAALGCSTVALPTPSGPVVARNMDWWPEEQLARASYLIRCSESGHFRYASAGWPGTIGVVTGLSARGFAVVLNAVLSPEGTRKTGYPVLLHLRRVLEDAADFDAALTMLKKETLASPALVTLVGSDNAQRVVIERTPTRHALRWAGRDEPLFATNDYRLLFKPQTGTGSIIYETTCTRYEALCRFFAGHRPDRDVEDEELLHVLSDPAVIQSITAQHILMRPRTGAIRLFVPRRLLNN
jgi:Acyl-coenzyme A:6-aminopenicillanic acid acyl-transferase